MKTRFQNLFYLQNALNKLQIEHKTQKVLTSQNDLTTYNIDLTISQKNGHDIKFCWNEQEYALIVDMSYWNQPYPVELFLDKIAQQYAGEVIIGESKKLGFEPVKYQKNNDGSNTLILERWNKNDL
jgi:hypothetical protein